MSKHTREIDAYVRANMDKIEAALFGDDYARMMQGIRKLLPLVRENRDAFRAAIAKAEGGQEG